MPLNHLIGLIKTALFNANKSEAECNANAQNIDELTETVFDQEIRLACIETDTDYSEFDNN